MSHVRGIAAVICLAALSGSSSLAQQSPPDSQAKIDFQRQIRPILSDNCFLCHGPDKGTRMVDLRLDIREGAFSTRKNGTVIVPGKPEESLLIKRIYSDNLAFRMPPVFSHKTLTQTQKDTIRTWIEQGAQWKDHWAFIAPVRPPVPRVKNANWPKNPIDNFILASLDAHGLPPAPEAGRHALIRRVTLDLTGLPPTPAEVQAFVEDRSPDAYEKVVDRLLASPHYGEQRAHYWLDAARYADTHGLHIDNYREIWPYRDWVIGAFNRNLPFDQFTIEQLAGDLLPNPTLEQRIATGFHRCNVTTNEGGTIPAEVAAIYAKDRADTTGTVWLGLTVGCATCHDHKFDPISQKDYYSLTSFFRNTTQNPMDGNVPDTPPSVVVPRAEDREQWDKLNAERVRLQQALNQSTLVTNRKFEKWLASSAHRSSLSYESSSNILPVLLPSGITAGEGPPGTGTALHFGNEASVSLPNVSEIDTDKPFSISTWVYLPKTRETYVVASQLEGSDAGKMKGWAVELDSGVVGVSGQAPSIRLAGEDKKYLSARPVQDFELKPETWYHIVFAYDGSRQRAGLSLYVNGEFVPTYGTGEDLEPLNSSIKVSAPLTLGKEGAQYFSGGAISDFRVLDKRVDEVEAKLLYLSGTVAAAARKMPSTLSEDERKALRTYYTYARDPKTRKMVARLREVDAERYAIARRGAIALVMQERTDTQPMAHVLYRGQYDQPRDEVHPKVPSVLPPMPESFPRNRLGLARWLVDAYNPLTARVTVNRFWQEVFGTGIVKTVEDFGSQGEPPLHPELLDWLAVDFRESGWDVKRFFRLMVTSATYRQAAVATDQKIERDPDNRLLSRGPRFRMDAEMVRDYALAASGLLNATIGGPSVKPYQPMNIWETVAMDMSNTRFYKRDTGDKLYRRSLYTFWKRSAPPSSMDIFNAPARETCTVRRERTDTPLQALLTMNDPQFVEAARTLAQHALLSSPQELNGQINYMADRLLARDLEAKELEIASRSYNDFLSYYTSKPADAGKLLSAGESRADPRLPKPEFAAMTMIANELLNLDEVLVK